jgi:hypothetical protein
MLHLPFDNLLLTHGIAVLLLQILPSLSNWNYFFKYHHEKIFTKVDHVYILVHREKQMYGKYVDYVVIIPFVITLY